MLRVTLAAVLLLLVAYAGLLTWFRLNEDSLIFEPDLTAPSSPGSELQLRSRDVRFEGPSGLSLSVRVIPPPPSVGVERAVWLLYFHGSSGNIGLPAYNEAWAQFRDLGLGVFAVDYRGFGLSEGEISEAGLYKDARAAYDYLRREMQIPHERIVIYGFSMGAAVAIELATQVQAAALLVEGSWLSIPVLGEERYPFLPASLIAKNRFDSASRIAQVRMPKLFLHAQQDEAIPVAHSKRLFEMARVPKLFVPLDGTHGTSHRAGPGFFRAVSKYLKERGIPLAP